MGKETLMLITVCEFANNCLVLCWSVSKQQSYTLWGIVLTKGAKTQTELYEISMKNDCEADRGKEGPSWKWK